MSGRFPENLVREKLTALAAILIPSGARLPAADAVASFDEYLDRATLASGWSNEEILKAIKAMPDPVDWGSAKTMATDQPENFAMLSHIVSAAYYMAPDVLQSLGFPESRQHPAGVEDFVDELETGILEKVMNSEKRYRDVK